jgi:hypothetical protein
MDSNDQFSDFLRAVQALRDDAPVRTTAHTSNASAHGWFAAAEATDALTAADDQ